MAEVPVLVESINKTYRQGKKSVKAVCGISFSMNKGEVLCLLGPNGSGKTTTLKIICGLIQPDSGEVKIYGENIFTKRAMLKEIGVVMEGNRNIYPYLSPYENIKYYARICGFDGKELQKRAEDLLRFFAIFDRKDDPAYKLSLGMQQKVALCCAMAPDPSILLLDEPSSGLDVLTKRDVMKTISSMRRDGKSILLMTHQMDIAEKVADRIVILNRGRIVLEGNPKTLACYLETGDYRIRLYEDPNRIPKEILAKYNLSVDGLELVMSKAKQEDAYALLQKLGENGFNVLSFSKNMTLEEGFIRLVEGEEE